MVCDVTEIDQSLERFITARRPVLERALVARLGVEAGLEAAADAVVYACEHWDRIGAMDNPTGYLFRVGQTSARRQRRWQQARILEGRPITVAEPVDVDLQRALMHLRPEQRVAVMLTLAFGHTHQEVAEILDCTTSSVGNHVSRGLARLRKLMDE